MRDSQKGLGLILALLILCLLSLLAAGLATAVTVDAWIGDNYRTETQLLYLTEAGIEEGRDALLTASPAPPVPSAVPFIQDRPLLDTTGRPAGRYSVTLVRSNPLTLRSAGMLGTGSKTIEVRLQKSGFPRPADAITLNEDVPLPDGVDPQLGTPLGLERIVRGISRNATDVYTPAWGEVVSLGSIGSPADYRVVVVDGDCEFGNASGRGILLVRGELTVYGSFSWNGLILVIGQGVLRSSGMPTAPTAWMSGGVFLARTRAADRSSANPLGTILERRGAVTLDLPAGSVTIERSESEVELANRRFPYVATSYREY